MITITDKTQCCGCQACANACPQGCISMQPGDVPVTYADTSALEQDFGFKPRTSLREGLRHFAQWYKDFYCKETNK